MHLCAKAWGAFQNRRQRHNFLCLSCGKKPAFYPQPRKERHQKPKERSWGTAWWYVSIAGIIESSDYLQRLCLILNANQEIAWANWGNKRARQSAWRELCKSGWNGTSCSLSIGIVVRRASFTESIGEKGNCLDTHWLFLCRDPCWWIWAIA